MKYEFLIVDVFSNEAFGGNQLAVLVDASGITPEGMQKIAREFNFAESTFVLPPNDDSSFRHVRIFTPGAELPFAGHPTVGTACALAMAGKFGEGQIVLREGVGPVSVEVSRTNGVYAGRLRLEQAPALADIDLPPAMIARALSIDPAQVLGVFGSGAGVNFTFVQVASRDVVDRSAIDLQAWREALAGTWAPQVYVFAGALENDGDLYGRMYAPALGIPEDPATGSAAAALVGAAATRLLADGRFSLNIEQGVAMGRRSLLSATASLHQGRVEWLEVGGECAFVARGEIEVADHYLAA